MNISEKTALYILNDCSKGSFRAIDRRDIADEYPYVLKELVRDGYLEVHKEANDAGETIVSGHYLTERGRMRLRMLIDKWEEER